MREIKLNQKQSEAVEQIDGPLLVLAGPGTGKTQLLSARVAKILEKTDTIASNILCLTFTEKGATNMLERLTSFIGQLAYEVNINTYHAFGEDLIRLYPQFLNGKELESPIDSLGQHEVVSQILDSLSYHNPLKTTKSRYIISTISDVKNGLLTSDKLREIAKDNLTFISEASPKITNIFGPSFKMPRKLAEAKAYFNELLNKLNNLQNANSNQKQSLVATSASSLEKAILEASELNKTTPLTSWKNDWLIKDTHDNFVLDYKLASEKILALADVIEEYQEKLTSSQQYDYDDMILYVIDALEANDDFRYTLQEKYQYILLDEYQDTNSAQSKLIELLTNNPISEGRPNVMAVGDDDQAIYSFQGAEASNLAEFASRYRNTKVINLTENYRSQPAIIETFENLSNQIKDRASERFDNISKNLQFIGGKLDPVIERRDFSSTASELYWVAKKIKSLVSKKQIKPNEIAVLSPRHKYLEALVPYLNELSIPVRYEKRENILEVKTIRQLIKMSRLVLALNQQDEIKASSYWPEILSYDFWNVETETIWQISWRLADNYDSNWTRAIIEHKKLRKIGLFFLQLANLANTETLETMLDYLIGTNKVTINDPEITSVKSTFREYYVDGPIHNSSSGFFETISHLTVLRQVIRDREKSQDDTLRITDFVNLVDLYETANERLINTSPYNQSAEAVQLMTVYRAKGLEFEHVFLLDCTNEVWGPSTKTDFNKVSLPPNLANLRHDNKSEDEQLRLLFVALSRAKNGLYLTSPLQNFAGKSSTRLKYFDEISLGNNTILANVLPEKYRKVELSRELAPELKTLELNWQNNLTYIEKVELKDLLQERLKNYQLNPTHLNTFVDIERGGPNRFLLNSLLKFPEAPSPSASYGTAIHNTLQWLQNETNKNKKPSSVAIIDHFKSIMLRQRIAKEEIEKRVEQGESELLSYLKHATFNPHDEAEVKFKHEAVFVNKVHLNGKIDKLEIDKKNHELVIVDYKTGPAFSKWESNLKLYKYKQQLYFYKLLVENSATWKYFKIKNERLDFIQPNRDNESLSIDLKFNEIEFENIKKLIMAVWSHIMNLNFPDISSYTKNLAGTRQFEKDLIEGKI